MLSIPALRISFLVFQVPQGAFDIHFLYLTLFLFPKFLSVGLLTLLLATQYFCRIKRHPVVLTLLVGDILRSLLGMLPGLLWRSLSQHVPRFVNDLARVCGIDGLLCVMHQVISCQSKPITLSRYGYFLSARLAFDVSLLFCIFVIVRRADSPEDVSLEFPRRLGITLAISPYSQSLLAYAWTVT